MTFQVGDHVIEKKYPWITYRILGFNEKSGKARLIEIQWCALYDDTNWYTPSSMSPTELPISDLFRAAKFRTIDNLICKNGQRCKISVGYYRYDNWYYDVWFPDEKRGYLLPEEDLSFADAKSSSASNTSSPSSSSNMSSSISSLSTFNQSKFNQSSSSSSSNMHSSSASNSNYQSSSRLVVTDFDEKMILEAIEQSKISAEEHKKKQIEEYERHERELAEKAALVKAKMAIIYNDDDDVIYNDDDDDDY